MSRREHPTTAWWRCIERTIVVPALALATVLLPGSTDAQPTEMLGPNALQLLGPPPGAEPLPLSVEFHLHDIDAIDDGTETVQFAGTLLVRWKDQRQAFDTASAGVNEKLFSDPYQYTEQFPTWVPEVDLMNAYSPLETRSRLLRIAPDGTCLLVSAINGVAKIRLELHRYPFDQQQLALVFRAHGYTGSEVLLSPGPRSVIWDPNELRVPQWTVQRIEPSANTFNTTVLGRPVRVSTFVITLDLSRDPVHMLRLVLIPLALIVILSWSVFWMDRSSLGDRMGVSFVGILTAVTYQVIIADTLPDISYMTFIHGFVNLSFLLMCLTVAVNLLVGVSDHNGNTALGDRIDRHCRWGFPVGYMLLLGINWAVFH